MEFGRYIHAFPYLNFVAVYTEWDETPDSLWDVDYDKRTPQLINEAIEKGLADNITVGFWVHDNTIEVLNPKDAYNKLKEVERSVGKPSLKYSNYYYSDNKIIPYAPDYLRHCIDSYTNEKVRDQLLKNVKHEALHKHIKI